MPAASTAGLLGGLIRQAIPNKEDLWNFGPFTFLNIPKAVVRLVKKRQLSWEMAPLGVCVRARAWPRGAGARHQAEMALRDPYGMGLVAGIDGHRHAHVRRRAPENLEQHAHRDESRAAPATAAQGAHGRALRQINPHFLFNTLNTVSSLIRFDPDNARGVVLKLSNILRRLLRKHETFVPLREELEFIDDYLDIEVARFGRDNLDIIKQIDEETLEAFVPSMLLQPIVENCLKHGLAPKLDGGKIQLRTTNRDGRLHIEIEDNGVGISEEKMPHVYVEGIGLSNVRERLRVLYGADFHLQIESRPGQGTLIKIDIPELVSSMQPVG